MNRKVLSKNQKQLILKELKNKNNFNINNFKRIFWDFSLNEYRNFNKDLFFFK